MARIRTTLVQRRGVESVKGDPARKEITVCFDPAALGDTDIRGAIEAAGFAVAD